MNEPPGPTGLLPVDRLVLAYLAITGLLAPAVGGAAGLPYVAAHALAAGAVLWWARRPAPAGAGGRFLRLAYPVALTPLLYAELAGLNQLLVQGYLDPTVRAWEEALLGSQWSMEAVRRLPSFWLSEFLHAGYFSYYALVPAALVGAYVTRGPAALHRVAYATALAFYLSYVIFAVFPVSGPRYDFPPLEGPPSEGAFHALVHAVLEGGSSRGTAFPSSHVAAAGAAVLAAGLEDRRWLWLLLPAALALTVGTVYGRFHYGVDVLAGALLAGAAAWAGPRLAGRGLPWPARPTA